MAGYVGQSYGEGAVAYVDSAYARTMGLPVAALRNDAGEFVKPAADNVTAALNSARIDDDSHSAGYMTAILDGVYTSADPDAYPISAYSYAIVPTSTDGAFTTAKGAALDAFLAYALCAGQREASAQGTALLPPGLVTAALTQLARIPGAAVRPTTPCAQSGETATDSIGLQAPVLAAVDGALSFSVPASAEASLGAATLVGGLSTSTGSLPSFSVIDERAATRPGFSVYGSVTDFTSSAGSFPASALRVAPTVVAHGTTSAGVVAAPAFFGSASAQRLAEAPLGSGVGTTVLGGALEVVAPAGTAPGTYRGTMTITVVSR